MPTYLVDVTLTDRYAPGSPTLRRLKKDPPPGWEYREDWKVGSVYFCRMTSVVDAPRMGTAVAELARTAEDVFGSNYTAKGAQLVVRDAAFELEDLLPYRYRKPRPRANGSGAAMRRRASGEPDG